MDKIATKEELVAKLTAYAETPDDDTIRIKNKIHDMLLQSPELLYALHSTKYESELFNPDGTINYEGDWDLYYGTNGLIRPFLFIPQTQDEVANYLCYQVSTDENVRYDNTKKYVVVTFTVFVHGEDSMDKETSIARHDLIGSIIREMMAWSGFTDANDAVPVGEDEGVTDSNYVSKVLKYQSIMPNNLVTTDGLSTKYTNKSKR